MTSPYSNQPAQAGLGLSESGPIARVDEFKFEPIRGYPMLQWAGKRPFSSTQYYPAQHRETHGPEVGGWRNKLYWGDNLQVMSHLLKQYRGQVKLTYIDPPFASSADYKRVIAVRGTRITSDRTNFEDKQYADIWANDEYLQFMYERLILIRELLSDDGALFVHCDWHANSTIRLILDEVFGAENFRNEVVWAYRSGGASRRESLPRKHDTILLYARSPRFQIRPQTERQYLAKPFMGSKVDDQGRNYVDTLLRDVLEGEIICVEGENPERLERYNVRPVLNLSSERTDYPTQKPIGLIRLLCRVASNPGDLVFDGFMGSGTTGVVAMKLGRRFLGADINLGAVQITTKRLLAAAADLQAQAEPKPAQPTLLPTEADDESAAEGQPATRYTGFEVYNVNNYDVFRNPVQARDLLLEALEVNPLPAGSLFDGEKDGRMWKLMPVNRIATRQDLNELINGFDYKALQRAYAEAPNKPVEQVTLVCMGHEPDLAARLQQEMQPFLIDVRVVDILRDKQDIQFKRDSEAVITLRDGALIIERFWPMTLMTKLSQQKEDVTDWRELVDSVMIDWNYDGAVLEPAVVDVPPEGAFVSGRYPVPPTAGTIRVKITDLLSESLEMEVRAHA